MGVEAEMQDALGERHDALALACMDTATGLMLGLTLKGDVSRDQVELAALAAADLCTMPVLDASTDDPRGAAAEGDIAVVASSSFVHVFARVPRRRDLVVVGLGRADANVALLRAWLCAFAERVGPGP